MNRFILKNTFIKNIHIVIFNKYFYKNKKLKLSFKDRVVVLNDFLYKYRNSTYLSVCGSKRASNLAFSKWKRVRACALAWMEAS